MHTIPCNWSEIMSSFETIVKVQIIVIICIYYSCYIELMLKKCNRGLIIRFRFFVIIPNWKLFLYTLYIYCRNEPRPCGQILNGSPIGYDLKPFVDQLVSLRGSRRGGRISRLAAASFRRVSASPSSQTRKAPNVGFKIPNPKDVVGNILKLTENDNNNNPTRRTNRLQSQSFRRAFWQRN